MKKKSIINFAQHVLETKTIGDDPVVCFVGKHYPLLFFSWFLSHIRTQETQCISLDVMSAEESHIKAQLETSFLGQKSVYWLGDLTLLSAAKKRSWIGYMQQYAGPHTILFFLDEEAIPEKQAWNVVAIPEVVDARVCQQLLALVTGSNQDELFSVMHKVVQRYRSLSFDQAYLFTHYVHLNERVTKELIVHCLDHVFVADASLFALSTAFFARDKQAFFSLWSSLCQTYSPQFWISFWGQQLWRSYWFVRLMNANKRLDAKKIAYRLPFSFIQKDWRMYESHQLKDLHDRLYEVDFHLKNGGEPSALDAFYTRMFD